MSLTETAFVEVSLLFLLLLSLTDTALASIESVVLAHTQVIFCFVFVWSLTDTALTVSDLLISSLARTSC